MLGMKYMIVKAIHVTNISKQKEIPFCLLVQKFVGETFAYKYSNICRTLLWIYYEIWTYYKILVEL